MRKAFISALHDLAGKDKKIFLLTGDLGFSFLETFQKDYPDRFFDVGIAEQNMIGIAAGLALTGKIAFAYSIVPFVTMRCFEQIRNDLCFQNLNVKLIGIGGGVAYGTAGPSHHATEDVAVMRSLVNMTVITPGDPIESEMAIKYAAQHDGPVYVRLGKGNEPAVHSSKKMDIRKGIVIEDGKDLTIIVSGGLLNSAKQVTSALVKQGLSVRLISMPMIKPLDEKAVLVSAARTKAIFTIEEHGIIGGLADAVGSVLARSDKKVLFEPFALPDKYNTFIGSQDYLLDKHGLSAAKISKKILKIWGEKNDKRK
jgi:transketolase